MTILEPLALEQGACWMRSMTWEIEVGRPGCYEVFLNHTCPDGDTGTHVGISFSERSTSAANRWHG